VFPPVWFKLIIIAKQLFTSSKCSTGVRIEFLNVVAAAVSQNTKPSTTMQRLQIQNPVKFFEIEFSENQSGRFCHSV
jgi:hypothetical protein